jgi:hypothetical protein
MELFDFAIIGGGASGLFALQGLKEKKVVILEGNEKLALKLLATGGGKCNFTNLYISHDNFVSENPHFVKSFLARYGTYDFLDLVEKYQIPYEERYLSRSVCKDEPHNKPSALYYSTQQKIAPFSFSSVIWYQGESNTGDGEYKIYGGLLKELISCWRSDFNDEDLPFIVIVIADFDSRNDNGWKNIQQIQRNIQKEMENVISVESADVCESFDIHPPTKTLLSERIAKIVLS